MVKKNQKKLLIEIGAIILLLSILGIVLLCIFLKDKTNLNPPSFLDKINSLSNYQFTLQGKINGESFSAEGFNTMSDLENKTKFSFHKDNLEYQVGEIEYIINYDTKKVLQNIYFQNKLLASNKVFENEEIEIKDIDFTRILYMLGEILDKNNVTCQSEECLYTTDGLEKNQFLIYINLITMSGFEQFFEKLNDLELKYIISDSENKIKKVTVVFDDENHLELSFVY